MARTIEEIQQSILVAKTESSNLSSLEILTAQEQSITDLNSTSKLSIWRLWIWIFSYVLMVHEKIVETNAANSRPHTIKWYRDQCLNYLDGLSLTWQNGQFMYDLTGITDVETRQIISRCAVLESNNGALVVKVARFLDGTLQPLNDGQLVRFKTYMNQIKDAGNRIRFVNKNADFLKIGLTVYVDPLIIDLQTGQLLNQQTQAVFPVKNAITTYIQNLEFNGAFVKEYFRDELQKAIGVKLPLIDVLQSQYAGFEFQDVLDWSIPESGYFQVQDLHLNIIYKAYELGNY
ncbi:hypothetical protein B0A58_07465 [Flavobacterium branchiophilum NBRC 15030 = ATCC 35035]|uniref:Nucleotidyltransferase n=1 Tax=Flavobacterium branchiophilum TaxID=55197 RepID=A0A543G109_9FLAO|nr:hypothetical protein [Flavobacterium branchiophilum]OXA76402.1 hypothetical protein B0A58_07465 [Flavobacterium branchiophilum NBRC 15030 = ATCC 35035]TQM39773.1 hypothetical protein BC670_0604 [Flavobacterium branchiophilum]GEM55234.1 hypothetical protein FB1_14550 [Flavobacterium branchiophilum NBRC 15030 = ATCC 35035]